MSRTLAVCVVAALLVGQSFGLGQATTTTAVNESPEPQKLSVQITAVRGMVQVRASENDPWQKAEVGMELSESAEFRTGPKSAVQFVIPPDQTITVDRLGVVKVLQAVSQNGQVKTDLGMQYGRTRFDIAEGGPPHESTIRSPSATLAVRGTRFVAYDQRPFVAEGVSLQGRVQFRDARKQRSFGGQGAQARISADKDSAAETALSEAVVDPSIAYARTQGEAELIATLISRGAVASFDREIGIPVIRGGKQLGNSELIDSLPGALSFVARWNGNADLNLGVASPGRDFASAGGSVYPLKGLTSTGTGGRTGFDHRGGEDGGIEIVFWPDDIPRGNYSFGVQHVSGKTANVRLEAYRNGERIDVYDFSDPNDPLGPKRTVRREIQPGSIYGVLAPVGVPPPGLGNLPKVSARAAHKSSVRKH